MPTITATANQVIKILDRLVWPVEAEDERDEETLQSTWRSKAGQVVLDDLMVLAGVRWNPATENDVVREFPARELHDLQAALSEVARTKYRTLGELPLLAQVDRELCSNRIAVIDSHKKIPFPTDRILPCAEVLININLDRLGVAFYEVECTDEIYTAESFDRFSTSSQWHVLRDYLLKGLTARWAKILTKMQYNIVRDLIGFCEYVEDRKAGVRKVWKQMKDAFDSFKISDDPRTLMRCMMAILHDYSQMTNRKFPPVPPSSAPPAPPHPLHESNATIESPSRFKPDARYSTEPHGRDRSRSPRREVSPSARARSPHRRPATPERSLRKQVVYGHRS